MRQMELEKILEYAEKLGASDVHMAAGLPPKLRLCGNLDTIPGEPLTAEDTMEAARSILDEAQLLEFREKGEYDKSFSLPRGGRYRVNIFRSQGNAADRKSTRLNSSH